MDGWQRRFFTVWVGQAFSLFGSSLANFALIWWITQETRSATVLAIGTIVTMLPGIVIGPFAGALVDRWDRRRVMIVADATGAVAAAALAILFATGRIEVWHIYTAMFVRSLAGAFHFPAMQASTALMVPDEQLTRVAGLNQMLQGASGIIAPPLGALLVSLLPFAGLMSVDIVTALLAVGATSLVQIPSPARPEQGEPASLLADTLEGLRYIWHWQGLRYILLMSTALNLLLTPAFALMPILVTRYFSGGAYQLAGLEAAQGIGFIAGGMLLGVWGGFKRRIMTMALGLAGLALAALLLGLAPPWLFAMALAGVFTMGLMSPLTNGPLFAIVQSIVPPKLQGRVFTVAGSVSMGISPLGLAVAGPLADRFGVQIWYVAAAVLSIVLLLVCLATPAIMRIEDRGAEPLQGAEAILV
jgi:DHA3 family macrolide efflux protein-like MFS transporter